MQPRSTRTEDLDLRNYLQVPRRRWKVIALFAIVVPAVSVLISLRQEPRYAASSEVLVKRQNLAASLTPGQVPYTDAQTAERVIETQVQLGRVPDLADRVITTAGLAGRQTPAAFLASSTVTVKPNSDILVFTVERSSPAAARLLAGIYADEFTMYRRQLDTTELDALAASVRGQSASIDPADATKTPLRDDLEEKLRQIQTLQALQTSSAVVVRRPDVAARVGPTPVTMGAGGLVLGLLLGGGLAFLLESLDTRVRRSSEVGAILGLPVLARLPHPPARREESLALVVVEEPDSPAAEGFAFLQTNLTFANTASEAKVIMFCSAMEQEGKSTTISNLAVTFARSGSRVVLVDLDHRRPTIHSLFSISRSPGVNEVCQGTVDLDQALRDIPIPSREAASEAAGDGAGRVSLHVLTAGGVTHSIGVDDVVGVLDRLRDRADVVLVDSPPLLLVGEALALTAKMDALVVVTRLNHVRKPLLEELRRSLEGAGVRPLGFVATAASEEPGYSRYYGHAYGYAPDTESPMPAEMPPPSARAVPAAAVEPNGSRRPPPAPVRATETAPAGSSHREALRGAVLTNGPRLASGPQRSDVTPAPTAPVGVRPRRSWVGSGRDTPAPPSPDVVDDAVPSGESPPSSSRHAGDEDGEAPGDTVDQP